MGLCLNGPARLVRSAVMTAIVFGSLSAVSRAQTPARVSLDTVFFADNVEFFSPFRTGETILGSWQRVDVDLDVGRPVSLKLGLYALERDGSSRRSELARPVVALTIGSERQRFVIGTLETTGDDRRRTMGPDVTTPHHLLPALAVETLWFSRAYEAGAQWRVNTERLTQDVWFNYQKLVTAEHRELFDGGVVGKYHASQDFPIAFLYQWHVVHHGGQQFHTGPVSDSFGYGPGLLVERALPVVGKASLEAYALFSYDRPDRQQSDLTTQGHGRFVRLMAEKRNWRAHVLAWQGHTFKHEAGDPNYLSVYPDGTTARGHRDYGEAGLARRFTLTPTVDLEASGRAHLVQRKWGYSYRLLATVHVPLWPGDGRRATPPPAASDSGQ
jgi:hypothetical protein